MDYAWPQYALLALYVANLCLNARDHGKPKAGKDNFWVALTAVGINVALLKAGGFF